MGASLLHLAQFASTAPAQYLVASVWQGLLLTMVAWLGLRIAPKIGLKIAPSTRFILWMIVFVLAALLPFSALADGGPASDQALSAAHFSAIWAVVIVALWAISSLFAMGRLLVNIYRLDTLARTSTRLPSEALSDEIRSLLADASPATSPSRPVEICLSDRIDSPVVIGFFRAAVVIPRWLWSKLTPSELHQIVVHELAHLGRRDDWTNLLQKFLRALFPLNPALLVAERQLCWEREMACDDAVLDASISPKAYATCLTNLAEKRILQRVHSLAPGAWRRRSELAERVHRILERKGSLRPLRSRPVVAAFLAAYLFAGLALARCPRLVAFSDPTGDNAQRSLEAHAQFHDQSAHLVPASLRAAERGAAPARMVDATFRTVVPAIHPKNSPRVTRTSTHRRSSRFPKASFAKASLVSSRLAQAQLVEGRLEQARLIESQFIEPLLTQAEDESMRQPAADGNAAQVILSIWILPSLPAADSSGFSNPRFTGFRSNSSWIVIQL